MSLHSKLFAQVKNLGNYSAAKPLFAIVTGSVLCAFASIAINPSFAADTAAAVSEGQKVPEFSLSDEKGNPVKPDDFKGKRFLIFFYDADLEPVSAKEAQNQQKEYKKLKLENTDVIGIGPDPVASHKAMKTPPTLKLNYHLLADKDDAVRNAFGFAPAEKGKHNHYAIIVDKNMTVKKVVSGGGNSSNEEDMAKALKYLGDFEISAY